MNKRSTAAMLIAAALPFSSTAYSDGVIVSAARTAQTVNDVLAPVSVITREDIEQLQAQSVQEILDGTAGLTVSNNGGAGKNTSIFLRGAESDHILVLIDGIKVGSATSGTTSFQFLPIEQIERIEVVRGPRSHLYGSEAIGGVVQIFTRKGGGEFMPSVSIGGGSFGTRKGSLNLSGGGDNTWFNLGASAEQTDGYNACTGEPNVAGCFTDEPDDDSHENRAINIRAGMRFENDAELDFHWLNSDSETEFDGSFQNYSESEQEVLGIGLSLVAGDNTDVDLKFGRSEDLSTNYNNGVFSSFFNTTRDSITAQFSHYVGDEHTFVGGVDYQDDEIESSNAFVADSRDNTGLFLEYLGRFGDTDLQVGIRRDDNDQFGENTTGGVSVGRQLSGGQQVTIAYATAFKAPTFNELYFPGFGNPDLEPEESSTVELGVSGVNGAWSVNIFSTDVDELIGFDPNTFQPVNIDESRIRGLELVSAGKIGETRVRGSLTLLDPENRASGFEGNQLPRRAKRSLRIDMDRSFDRFDVGATLLHEGDKFDDLGNLRGIDSYTVVDARASMAIADDWRLQLKVENLFDESYETASFYPQPERSFYVTLRYSPGSN